MSPIQLLQCTLVIMQCYFDLPSKPQNLRVTKLYGSSLWALFNPPIHFGSHALISQKPKQHMVQTSYGPTQGIQQTLVHEVCNRKQGLEPCFCTNLFALEHHIRTTPTDLGCNKTTNISTLAITCKSVMGCKTSTEIALCLVWELHLHLDVGGVHCQLTVVKKGEKPKIKEVHCGERA